MRKTSDNFTDKLNLKKQVKPTRKGNLIAVQINNNKSMECYYILYNEKENSKDEVTQFKRAVFRPFAYYISINIDNKTGHKE